MTLSNLNLKTRLTVGFGSIALIILIVTAITTSGIYSLISNIKESNSYHNLMAELKEREVNHLDWLVSLSRGVIEEKPDAINVETDSRKCKLGLWYYSDSRKQIEKDIPVLSEYLNRIEEPHQRLHGSATAIIEALKKGASGKADAQKIFFSETIPELVKVRENLNTINNKVQYIVESTDKNMASGATMITSLSIGLSVAAIAVVIVFSVIFIRGIMHQLGGEPSYLIEVIKKVADGDLGTEINVKRNDSSSVVFIFKSMTDYLEKMVRETMFSLKNLYQAVNEISTGNSNLSQRTSEQAASLEEIVSTIEEASVSISKTAENAGEANTLSNDSSKLAVKGGELVNEAVASINNINHASKKINEIIDVINDIAFQTNLLSLNAAVEAARAGEHGRGFSIVAGEVRNLAQRAGTASKEISKLIQNSIQLITDGTDKVNKSGSILSEIIESVKVVNNRMAEIAMASEEQKTGMDQITKTINEMDQMTQQNAALVEENSTASEEISSQAQEVLSMMERFTLKEAM